MMGSNSVTLDKFIDLILSTERVQLNLNTGTVNFSQGYRLEENRDSIKIDIDFAFAHVNVFVAGKWFSIIQEIPCILWDNSYISCFKSQSKKWIDVLYQTTGAVEDQKHARINIGSIIRR